MSRTIINLPSEFIFSTDIPIRIGDINHGGHLGHDSFLIIIGEARMRFFRSLGYVESNMTNIEGAGLIMTDASIVYLRQGNYGQTLRVEIAINDFTTRSFDMVYRVSDRDTGVEMARAKTGFVFYDYQKQKVVAVSPSLKEKLQTNKWQRVDLNQRNYSS